MTDLQEAATLSHSSGIIEIYSNSWGPSDSGQLVDGPGPLVQLAFETGARDVRNVVSHLGAVVTTIPVNYTSRYLDLMVVYLTK